MIKRSERPSGSDEQGGTRGRAVYRVTVIGMLVKLVLVAGSLWPGLIHDYRVEFGGTSGL